MASVLVSPAVPTSVPAAVSANVPSAVPAGVLPANICQPFIIYALPWYFAFPQLPPGPPTGETERADSSVVRTEHKRQTPYTRPPQNPLNVLASVCLNPGNMVVTPDTRPFVPPVPPSKKKKPKIVQIKNIVEHILNKMKVMISASTVPSGAPGEDETVVMACNFGVKVGKYTALSDANFMIPPGTKSIIPPDYELGDENDEKKLVTLRRKMLSMALLELASNNTLAIYMDMVDGIIIRIVIDYGRFIVSNLNKNTNYLIEDYDKPMEALRKMYVMVRF
ncbi:MAG: hypothetical protein Edafosvirus1_11 [Edafosvirus sp.]|uniref:Uncharacterized protein n=1 Tax=Edafosvirus sp. TaxID=2487765 RepID=A0A3G4ZS17_9VIRU|nr:MAG: hypothetical protein Edafosvirus1_11 [Edafosvirus sp.]